MLKVRHLTRYSSSASNPRVLYVALLVSILSGVCRPCSPGRGAMSSRRSGRKMTPLVFQQHLPNLQESSLGGSGSPEGRIRDRGDPRFNDLVTNFNPDIVFKDDEQTGEDRIMTQRCNDRLNTLAKSVMTHWPRLRLRVVEAWESGREGDHPAKSLHYEGRAVDVTTSDRDRSKYGMLARLAVEAGFDWVYYESRSHVHCSVKAENLISAMYGGCFHGSATVASEDGHRIAMSQLSIGNRVLSVGPNGALQYSDVVAFLHRDVTQRMKFQRMRTAEGHDLTVTQDHLIYVGSELGGELDWYGPTFATEVRTGSFLFAANATDSKPRAVRVVNVSTVVREGAYAPLINHGTVVVDGLVTSCYASFNSQSAAHVAMLPLRLAYRSIGKVLSGNSSDVRPSADGVHWYARLMYRLTNRILPEYFFHDWPHKDIER